MPVTITRRRFLAASAGLVGAAALGDGFLVEPTDVLVTRHDVPLAGLPPALDGVRIGLIADVHLARGILPAARVALTQLAREAPDVAVLAGDICNHKEDLPVLVDWARYAHGTTATFAMLGNWERAAGIRRATAAAAYDKAGVELLLNSTARLTIRGATLAIVGLDDPVFGKPDITQAMRDVRSRDTTVLAVHAPGYVDTIPASVGRNLRIILAGHTHGGQVRLPFWTPYVPAGSGRFIAGWYHDTPAPMYVTRGIGTVGIRARLFCPPELPIFTLRAASENAGPARSLARAARGGGGRGRSSAG